MVQEWERLAGKKQKDRSFLLAADRAVAACLHTGRFSQALAIAECQKVLAGELSQSGSETTETLRDLSISSLGNMGRSSQALGRWEQAEERFKEGLAITKFLATSLPEHVDYNGLTEHFRNCLLELREKKGHNSSTIRES